MLILALANTAYSLQWQLRKIHSLLRNPRKCHVGFHIRAPRVLADVAPNAEIKDGENISESNDMFSFQRVDLNHQVCL